MKKRITITDCYGFQGRRGGLQKFGASLARDIIARLQKAVEAGMKFDGTRFSSGAFVKTGKVGVDGLKRLLFQRMAAKARWPMFLPLLPNKTGCLLLTWMPKPF